MYYTKEYLKRAHREIDTIFRVLFPEHGMAVREEQIMLCHEMLDNLLGRNIALCDAGVGIGKTYAYLVACVLMRKYSLLAEGCSPYEQRPVVISTSSIALQKAILTEYIPFLSRMCQSSVRETARKEAHAGISSIWNVPEIMKCSFRFAITIICWLMVITDCRITARY